MPPYTAEFAPIELLFRSLKAKLKMYREKEWVSFIPQNGVELVTTTLSKIRQNEILKYWSTLFKQIKDSLHFIHHNW